MPFTIPLRALLLAALLAAGSAFADDHPGQQHLDEAIEAKLAADNLDDFATVLDLCKRALDKGLSDESKAFAENLYTGTLIDRAGMVVDAIFGSKDTPDPQWPRMRSFAMRDLNEAVERDPQLGEAHLMIARLEALPGGNRERATQSAEKALELLTEDKLGQARAHLVIGNLEDEDEDKRRAAFDKAVELAPRDADVRRTRGLFRLVNDEFAEARADLEVAIEENPDDASLQEALGMAHLMSQNLEDAQKAFDKALEINPQAPSALMQRARVLALKGEKPKAIADLDKAIEISPDDMIPLVLRARILQQAGETEKALADLEKVLEKQRDHPAALELRGLIAAERNDYPAAIRDFRMLVAKNSDDAVVIGQLGMLYLAAKQPREAIKRFTRALELEENQFLSRRGRSDAEISIGDHKAALADLEKALSIEPDDTGVLNNLAWLLATSPDDGLRDGKRAIELATKACEETKWEQAHIISTLAAGYAETGDFETARKYSKQAVEAGAEAPEVKGQLEKELASYEAEKPWRERQSVEDDDGEAKPDIQLEPPLETDDAEEPQEEEEQEEEEQRQEEELQEEPEEEKPAVVPRPKRPARRPFD